MLMLTVYLQICKTNVRCNASNEDIVEHSKVRLHETRRRNQGFRDSNLHMRRVVRVRSSSRVRSRT